jgi:purine-binding chemotaxis protein CheW
VSATPADAGSMRRFLTFRVGRERYAIPAEQAAEVIRIPRLARVPRSPPALLGIANLRGSVLPVVDLAKLLGMPDGAGHSDSSRAIVLVSASPSALAVEAIDALVAVPEKRIETREAELGANAGERLSGVFEVGDTGKVAKILDVAALLDAAFAQRGRVRPKDRAATTHVAAAVAAAAAAAAPQMQDVARTMLVTFAVAEQEFALELSAVEEILPAPAVLMALPRAEALVLGVTAVRDRLLPLLSLRGLLGFPPAARSDGREKVVVTTVGGARVGLVVDRARAIVAAPQASIEAIPAVLAARAGGESRIKGVYRGDAGRRLVSILVPEQLFREDVMQRLGEGRPMAGVREAADDSAEGFETFLVFRLGADEYGLPIESVDEVGDVPAKITRLPKTPTFLEGVVNLRGSVLPVIDQRRRFDMPPLEESARRRLVVLRSGKHRAGLIVDGVSDVLRVPRSAVELSPQLTDDIARLVHGVINLAQSQRIVLALDPAELLTPAERGLLDTFSKSKREKRDQSSGGR